MVEYEYFECIIVVVMVLFFFCKYWLEYRIKEIECFIECVVKWIKIVQKLYGGWYGSWGICFIYVIMFVFESLVSIGEIYKNSDYVKRGCDFLIFKQREDGGWFEYYRVCFVFLFCYNCRMLI